MKQKGKKQVRRRIRFSGLLFVIFMAFFVMFLGTSIFLKSVNVSLNITKQQYLAQIAAIKNGNENLQYDVKELSKYDRILKIIDKDMFADENVVYLASD